MTIAISSRGDALNAAVDPRFGCAAKFILFDTETGSLKAHGNARSLDAAQGAGIQAAETVSRLRAQVVIAGHCGPKAFRALRAAGIQLVTGAQGTVAEAIDAFRAGALAPVESADAEGQWA